MLTLFNDNTFTAEKSMGNLQHYKSLLDCTGVADQLSIKISCLCQPTAHLLWRSESVLNSKNY